LPITILLSGIGAADDTVKFLYILTICQAHNLLTACYLLRKFILLLLVVFQNSGS